MSQGYENMMGSPIDVEDHPARDVPDATQHYAGEVLPFPISQYQADSNRLSTESMIKSTADTRGVSVDSLRDKLKRVAPGKVIPGPGANQ